MKINLFIVLFVSAVLCICPSFLEGAYREITYENTNSAPDPIPDKINDILLKKNEFPSNAVFKCQLVLKDLTTAGWLTSSSPKEIVQGLVHTWAIDGRIVSIKYGYFDSDSKSRVALLNAIRSEDPFLSPTPLDGSFSGAPIGDACYHWALTLDPSEKAMKIAFKEDIAIVGFTKGQFAVVITGCSNGLPVQKNQLENFAGICEKKVDVAKALGGFSSNLQVLVSHKGIQNSLRVKIDHFTKNYRQGDYKTALNNINSFINELNAQRGKHVSESAYQTLKTYADTIVQSLNSLM